MTQQLLLITTVPPDALPAVLDAIASAGAGVIGEYTHCAFTSVGTGHFKPSAAASPAVGAKGEVNAVEEIRVETFCPRDKAKAVVAALRAAHPYEEPVIYLLPLLSEEEL